MNGAARGRIIRRAADIMRENVDDLAAMESENNGQPMNQAADGHVLPSADALEY